MAVQVTCKCGALGARAVEPMLLQKADEGRGGTTGA